MNFKLSCVVFLGLFLGGTFNSVAALKSGIPDSQIVRKIEFVGLRHTPRDAWPTLADLMVKMGTRLDSTDLKRDVEALYLRGYYSDVQLDFSFINNGVHLRYKLTENPVIEDVLFSGVTKVSTRQLKKVIKNKSQSVFNIGFSQSDIEAIRQVYHQKGYSLFDVTAVSLTPENSLLFECKEGVLSGVEVQGLDTVKQAVVYRDLIQKKGMVYNLINARKDRQTLAKMGFFSYVSSPKIQKDMFDDGVMLHYQVKERKTNAFDFGVEQLRENLGVAAFFQLQYRHLFLYSDKLYIKSQFLLGESFRIRSYSVGYLQPWLLNQIPISTGINLWTSFRKEPFFGDSVIHSNKRVGGDLVFSKMIRSQDVKLSIKPKIETVSPDLSETFSKYSIHSLTGRIDYDTREDTLNPKLGEYARFSFEKGGELLGLDLGGLLFSRWKLTLAKFVPINQSSVLGGRVRYGELYKQSDINTFESEAFILGGANSLRGHSEFAYYGTKRLVFNAEYRHDLPNGFQSVLFYDVGTVFDDKLPALSQHEFGYGFGFRYLTGLFPVRIDFAWGNDFIVHFGLGQLF
ncbi:hypothetical protein DID77_00620 [Candidatus Marinamargulisbacteria bacterium SCGC AG-439-L15]|nr:hypothetical protein DID77_00620 [Candidatus Marinamargulisbacteria bacterium SCGC AG-439-L15]